jgi:polysaccharide biosynthesis protein PslG
MPPRARVRSYARLLTLTFLVLALLAPIVPSSAFGSGSSSKTSAHSSTTHHKKKHKRKKRHKRKKCKRYRKVRVKRHGKRVTVKRCVRKHKKKTSTTAPDANTAPGAGANVIPRGPLQFGLNAMWNTDSDVQRVVAAGVSLSRMEVSWNRVEPQRGQWNWSDYDYTYRTNARNGMTILPVLISAPSWAESSWNQVPSNPADYAQYVAAVVARYGPGGTYWKQNPSVPYHPSTYFEVWNEPYWTNFAAGGSNPAQYARLFRAAAVAGRIANPQARFLLETDLTGYATPSNQVEWIDAMYAAVPDLNIWTDGIAVHPYSQPRSPDAYDPKNNRWAFRRLLDIRNKLVAHGAADKPFWITEVGYPTCPGDASKCVSESLQATYLQREFQIIKSEYSSFIQAVFIYKYRDPNSQNPSDMEDWFGLFRPNMTPKPAWDVLRRATGAI